MLDNISIKAPAKINLFLRVIGITQNDFHFIRTGVTFLNLYDEIKICLSEKNILSYSGPFKPISPIFENDIIIKVLDNIVEKKTINFKIHIIKNIPWKAGLVSASTDAASFIKGLQK